MFRVRLLLVSYFRLPQKIQKGLILQNFARGIMQLLPPPGSWTVAEKTISLMPTEIQSMSQCLESPNLFLKGLGQIDSIGVVVGDGAAMFMAKTENLSG